MTFGEEMHQFFTRAWTEQLYREYEQILYQRDLKLKKVTIDIRTVSSFWGRWDPLLREISLSRKLIEDYPWSTVIEILKHEMAHQWVNEALNSDDSGHSDDFRRACNLIGVADWARNATGDIKNLLVSDQSTEPRRIKLINRLRKLEALAESANENEAFLAMKRASELKEKYALSGDAETDFTHRTICHGLKINPQYQVQLTSLLVEFYQVDVIFVEQYDAQKAARFKAIEIIGDKTSVEIAEYVYDYLWHQLPSLWRNYKKTARKGANKRSYYVGVLTGLRRRLRDEALTRQTPLYEEQALVETERRLSIGRQDYLQKRHPKIRISQSRSGRLRDNKGFEAGLRSGRDLSIRNGIKTNNQQSIKFLK